MRGVNRVTLLGNVGQAPDMRSTNGGMQIASVSLATTSVRTDRDGNKVEKTEWHRLKFFGKLAEIVGQYVTKGMPLYVEGRISYSEVTGDDGQKRYFTDIIVDEMQMLGSRQDAGNPQQAQPPRQQQYQQQAPQQQRQPQRQQAPQQQRQQAPQQQYAAATVDDPWGGDIPF